MHDRLECPHYRPDLEIMSVPGVRRITMHAAKVTLFGMTGRLRGPSRFRERLSLSCQQQFEDRRAGGSMRRQVEIGSSRQNMLWLFRLCLPRKHLGLWSA
jgi:hypothetical protein